MATGQEQIGLLTWFATIVMGFFGFFIVIAKLILVAAAIGTGFGAPIILMHWWANRKKK